MSTATVTPIHVPRVHRAATRLGPKEARQLAQRARAAGYAPGAARALLELLLRVCDPRHGFSRQIPRKSRGRTEGLLDQLGVSRMTLVRAARALEEAGLVEIKRGDGSDWSTYTLCPARITDLLGELPGSPWGNAAVHPGEDATPGGSQSGTPPVTNWDQGGPNSGPLNARVRERDPRRPNPPLPRDPAHGPSLNDSPPASGQGPLSESEKCEHGRTIAQGGCRTCGTTKNQRARAEAAAQRQAEAERRRDEQLREREHRQAEKAAGARPDPELLAAARAGIQAGKHRHPPKEK